MRWLHALVMCLALVAVNAECQATNDEALSPDKQVQLAREGVSMLQGRLKDPDSLKLFQVLVISSYPHKYRGKLHTWYRGCIHYSATNSLGGRLQRWGSFQINSRSGDYYVSSSDPDDNSACQIDGKEDTVVDVTERLPNP